MSYVWGKVHVSCLTVLSCVWETQFIYLLKYIYTVPGADRWCCQKYYKSEFLATLLQYGEYIFTQDAGHILSWRKMPVNLSVTVSVIIISIIKQSAEVAEDKNSKE